MIKHMVLMSCVLAAPWVFCADSPSVKIDPPQLQGSRPLEKQTATAVVRDYLQSWKSFQQAMEQNRSDLLDPDFVGTARDKLTATIEGQAKLGIRTRYQDLSHDIQIVFYSPEGLSIQMIDNVTYTQQVLKQDKVLSTQTVHARYLVVLTPAERWSVRIFQAVPE